MKWLIPILLLAGCAGSPQSEMSVQTSRQRQAVQRALEAERQGRPTVAAQQWQSAIQLARLQDDWEAQGRAQLGLAQLLIRNGEYQAAAIGLKGLRENTLYSDEQRAQAALLLARAGLRIQGVDVAAAIAGAASFCSSTACAWQPAIRNVEARLALQQQDPVRALQIADGVLLQSELALAERSHALRTRAEALLAMGRALQALPALGDALVIDRQIGEPLWLLDDYRLQLAIASATGNLALERESRWRIESLCRALDEKVCGTP
ncbi:hypothetical protein [Chitinilyticum aquatile]|uniref:hypothetical protein n=1 Tax=Chitinilyticum aquatile TaxID=362520 RepID=UPI0003FA151E|nr:hypothetical protein [Chitinilyticum aquatile]